jgi:hypothetical protein
LAITTASESVHCGESLRVSATGNFRTNGAGGTVTYYWLRTDGKGTQAQPRQSMTIASGDTSLHTVATDRWTPTGSGSEQLVFVSPSYPLAAQNFVCGG